MTHRFTGRAPYRLALLLLLTLIINACGGGAQEPAAPGAQEQPAAAPTETPLPTTTPTETPVPTETPAVATTTPVTNTAPVSDTASVSDSLSVSETAAIVHTFVIDQSQSEARFSLNEKLMGQPKTVVGVTKLVSGTLTLDPADLAKATLSPIQIDARDLTTDSGMRNRAIQRFVLQSNNDEYRYIVFAPTALEGLPQSGNVGDNISFKILGDLTVSGVTKPVTFEANVIAESDTKLSGLAKTQILRSDFNLNIPNVPSVADVTDEVQLELQFVATAQ